METSTALDKKSKYQCDQCERTFNNNGAFLNHKKWKHQTNIDKHCVRCSKAFSKTHNLKRHMEVCKTIIEKNQLKSNLSCTFCNFCASNKREMENHYESYHDISLVNKEMEFEDMEGFFAWKKKFESETRTSFVKLNGTRKTKANSSTTYYICHRSGNYKPKGSNIRRIKAQGSNKINSHCPAKLKVVANDQSVSLKYVDLHVGHDLELSRLNITQADRKMIAEKLALKVPFHEILNEIRNSVTNNDLERIHLLNRKDLWNIVESLKQDLHLNSSSESLPLVSTDVDQFAEETAIMNQISTTQVETFETRKSKIVDKILEIAAMVTNEEQLKVLSAQIPHLEMMIKAAASTTLQPNNTNHEPPNQQIKTETILFDIKEED